MDIYHLVLSTSVGRSGPRALTSGFSGKTVSAPLKRSTPAPALTNMMQPNVTLNDDHICRKVALKWFELVDNITHIRPSFLKSSSVKWFSLLLPLKDGVPSLLFSGKQLEQLARELDVYSNGLIRPCSNLISYTWDRQLWRKHVKGKMTALPRSGKHTHIHQHRYTCNYVKHR